MASNCLRIFILVAVAVGNALGKTCTKEVQSTFQAWKTDPLTQQLKPMPLAVRRKVVLCCPGYRKVGHWDSTPLCKPDDQTTSTSTVSQTTTVRTTTAPRTTTRTKAPVTSSTTTTTRRPATTPTLTPSTTTRTTTPVMTSTTTTMMTTTSRPTTTSTTTPASTTMSSARRTTTTLPTTLTTITYKPTSVESKIAPAHKTEHIFNMSDLDCKGRRNCACPAGYTLDSQSFNCRPLCNGKIYGCIGGTCIGVNQCRCDEGRYIAGGELFHCQAEHSYWHWYLLLLLMPAGLIVLSMYVAMRRWRTAKAHRLAAQGESYVEVRLNRSGDHHDGEVSLGECSRRPVVHLQSVTRKC